MRLAKVKNPTNKNALFLASHKFRKKFFFLFLRRTRVKKDIVDAKDFDKTNGYNHGTYAESETCKIYKVLHEDGFLHYLCPCLDIFNVLMKPFDLRIYLNICKAQYAVKNERKTWEEKYENAQSKQQNDAISKQKYIGFLLAILKFLTKATTLNYNRWLVCCYSKL